VDVGRGADVGGDGRGGWVGGGDGVRRGTWGRGWEVEAGREGGGRGKEEIQTDVRGCLTQ